LALNLISVPSSRHVIVIFFLSPDELSSDFVSLLDEFVSLLLLEDELEPPHAVMLITIAEARRILKICFFFMSFSPFLC